MLEEDPYGGQGSPVQVLHEVAHADLGVAVEGFEGDRTKVRELVVDVSRELVVRDASEQDCTFLSEGGGDEDKVLGGKGGQNEAVGGA